jgi:hypothetical protein
MKHILSVLITWQLGGFDAVFSLSILLEKNSNFIARALTEKLIVHRIPLLFPILIQKNPIYKLAGISYF